MKVKTILIVLSVFFGSSGKTQPLNWALGFGAAGSELVTDVITDEMGNVYITGNFTETADFDPGIDDEMRTGGALGGPFIQKLDQEGNLVWVYTLNDGAKGSGGSLVLNADGSLLVTGRFIGSVDFANGADPYLVTSTGYSDLFVLKLDENGDFLWVKTCGANGFFTTVGHEIRLDIEENIYVCGSFSDTVDFDPGDGVFNLASVGRSDAFVLKLDRNGEFIWARSMGSVNDFESAIGMDLDTEGNIYMSGSFGDTVDFDPGADEHILIAEGLRDIFIQKLNEDGEFEWVYSIGSGGSEIARNIFVDSNDDIIVTGSFQSIIDLDPGPGSDFHWCIGGVDGFTQKVDSDGNLIWAYSYGDTGEDNGNQIREDALGNLYLVGAFSGEVDFDPGDDEFYLESSGDADCFLQKLDSNGNLIEAFSFGGDYRDNAAAIAVRNSGMVYIGGYFRGNVDFDPSEELYDITSYSGDAVDYFIMRLGETGIDGIAESQSLGFSVFPNPSDGVFSFNLLEQEIAELTVFDQRGRLVQNVSKNTVNQTIDLSPYENGVYFLSVRLNSGEVITEKLIKK